MSTVLIASVHAWVPADRDLAAFNRTYDVNGKRSLPTTKIRGVNLGGWLVSEPWMMSNEWNTIGCSSSQCSEFDCVNFLGQSTADQRFNDHYARWITPTDIQKMHDAGLNTIRIPIGYWSFRDIVDSSEHFPNMNLKYLDAVIQKAADLGMFVVMDLHGAPGAQKAGDAFTGQVSLTKSRDTWELANTSQCLPTAYLPGFFTQYNYDRAKRWLDWMTRRIHTTPAYQAAVGIIEVVNEPQTSRDQGGMPQQEKDTLTQTYYPQALAAVRAAEASLNIPASQQLHVQFMDQLWGAGNPKSNLPGDSRIVFDDHNYVGGAVSANSHPNDPQNVKQADYMWYTCYTDNRQTDGDSPKIVQEFSLTVSGDVENNSEFNWQTTANQPFYKQWWIAQQRLYEQTNGWIFWSWKTELNNPRWDYSYLVYLGWVGTSAAALDASRQQDVCLSYFGKSDGRN